jgi:uncharacterized membrane protein (DUF4010 family)
MGSEITPWPYAPTLLRLALAMGLGLFIGIERERRRKEAGLRTFAFASMLGGVGGLLDDRFALVALALLGILVVLLNIETIHTGEGAEITTSAALLLTGYIGILAGKGHTFTPTALAIATAGLLAWKEPLAGFSRALTESEFRSAVLLAILAFVIYPVLPAGTVDPYGLIEPRAAWVTIILIAALGFANYVLLKLYGARGIALTGFLGGLVNSTVTVAELASRVRESHGGYAAAVFRAVVLANAAMLVRNALILAFFAPAALRAAAIPLVLMLAGASVARFVHGHSDRNGMAPSGAGDPDAEPVPALQSPFSPVAALRFGLLFLGFQVAGAIAERLLGSFGFYAVSIAAGMVSSASAVASAATLASSHTLPVEVAATGAVLASMASAAVNFPILSRVAQHRALTRNVATVLWITGVLGVIGLVIMRLVAGVAFRPLSG